MGKRSGGTHFRVTILAESLRYFNGLAVGETAAILSEAKVECGGGSFPHCQTTEMTSDVDTRVKRMWVPSERFTA